MTEVRQSARPVPREPDLSLRRVERDAAIACVVMALLALVLQRGALSGALGVMGGGALMAYSFRAIRAGVDMLVRRVAPASNGTSAGTAATLEAAAAPPDPTLPAGVVAGGPGPEADAPGVSTDRAPGQSGVVLVVARFLLRYVVIGFAAWLLLAKLRAHPVGMMAGVTAPVLALGLEAIRLQRR